MDEFLSDRGFLPVEIDGTKEKVYGRFHRSEEGIPLTVRVYTSIKDGSARGRGKDAIRVGIFMKDGDGEIKRVGGTKRVNRIKTWRKNLANRLENWRDLLGPDCPHGHGPMVKRDGQYGEFYGCNNYPSCKHTEQVS
jgi:hypothetical protein